MIEGKSMETEVSTGRLRVALVGPEKNGKSVLFSTAPGNKLNLDYDQRREALAGKKDTYALTLKDPPHPKMPEVAEETIDIMSGLESSLDLSLLKNKKGERLLPDAKPGTILESLAFDSVQSFAKCVMDYETYNNVELCRKIRIGPTMEVRVPKNFDAWTAEYKTVESIILRAFALPINVFCMFHESPEESVDSTDQSPKYTGRVTVYPARYQRILRYFNEVWRVKLTAVPTTTGQIYLPRVYPLPDYSMDGATTMLLDKVEEPNISAMILKHQTKLGQVKK